MKKRTGLRALNNNRGSAFLSAMCFLVLLLGLGASFVQMGIQETHRASRHRKETRALNLAEAGLDYAAWRIYNDNPSSFPVIYSRTDLPEGTLSATVSQYLDAGGNPVANTVQVVSTGTSQGWTSQVKAIGQYMVNVGGNNGVFDHALFSDSDMTIGGDAIITGTVHSNGNMIVRGSSYVDGDASSSGWLNEVGSHVAGDTTAYAPKMPMPTVDIQYYRSKADHYYNSDQNFSGDINLDGIVFVDGDVGIHGQINGKVVIVATGKITVNGDVTLEDPDDDDLALVSTEKIKINGNCTIEGVVYAHNVEAPADVDGLGTANITGAVVADVIKSLGNLNVEYRPSTLELPGASTAPTQLDVVSWRRTR